MNMRFSVSFLLIVLLCAFVYGQDSITLQDLKLDKGSHAGFVELTIPSNEALLQGFLYRANGKQKHPTLILLHGYPGNERNLDLAQVVRSRGWNVIYFNYRGSWGSQGKFSFANAVEDVANVVAFCEKNQEKLQIDPSNIVLFGHSMGGWVCLKALQRLPNIRKGFALSTWNIYSDFKDVKTQEQFRAKMKDPDSLGNYFVLNSSVEEIFQPVFAKPGFYDLTNDARALSGKQIVMLDEHSDNKALADTIKRENRAYFDYQVWETDHSFTNKRVSLMNVVLFFLAR
jgi:pimeloyl-ACP methyl ester carboxylesterase